MSLKTYHKKRNFKVTNEPYGNTKPTSQLSLYLIQKHAATHLHYDFRIELNGTLKSWAIPKGPCLDPKVKRLAVHVEDHPLEYGSFEGIIPAGEYGGGTVMLWDTGTWECQDKNPLAAYKKGSLTFHLQGKKLKGGWKLIRMKNDPKNWLLIKLNDAQSRPEDEYDILIKKPKSVLSGLALEQITKHHQGKSAAAPEIKLSSRKKLKSNQDSQIKPNNKIKSVKTPHTKLATVKYYPLKKSKRSIQLPEDFGIKKPLPKIVSPELAFLSNEPPAGEGWLHEIKLDGYRIMCFVEGDEIRLITRNHHDWSAKFPSIIAEMKKLNVESAIFDGELVALNKDQYSDFQILQNAIHDHDTSHLIYYAFDLLYLNGKYIADKPLIDRKNVLHELIFSSTGILRYSDHVIHTGSEIYKKACDLNLEGIISKKIDSTYSQRRSHDWIKVKCLKRQEFIVIGFTQPSGKRSYFGSLLLAYNDQHGQLTYCGKVGTGFTELSLESLSLELEKYKTVKCPLEKKPKVIGTVVWARPKLIVEVEFTDWTSDGALRHPSFKGLRKDKHPTEIIKEVPKKMKSTRHHLSHPTSRAIKIYKLPAIKNNNMVKLSEVTKASKASTITNLTEVNIEMSPFTHPDKILYEKDSISKIDLANYYQLVAKWMLPHVAKRPLTIVRCPQGQGAKCFYQKHTNAINLPGLYSVEIAEKVGSAPYLYIKNEKGLMALVQLGVLEIHTWGCHIDKIEKPDTIIFDLDPAPDIEWKTTVKAAHFIREELEKINLISFVKTTGGKGLHIVIPIVRDHAWDAIEIFSHTFAEYLVSLKPDLFITNMNKAKRTGKIFLDYLRNNRGSTAITPYSTRASVNASLSIPLSWDELGVKIKPNTFTINNINKRLLSLSDDPWHDYFNIKQKLIIPK